jgi:methyltransferase (TIGR00027 family)
MTRRIGPATPRPAARNATWPSRRDRDLVLRRPYSIPPRPALLSGTYSRSPKARNGKWQPDRCYTGWVREGEASETAQRVAAQRLTFERVPADYGNPAADELLARDVTRSTHASPTVLRRYLEARTRFFDTVVVESIRAGIAQVVVGAAGYDGRAWRYAKSGVQWYEIDHPSTQGDKLRRLRSLGIDRDHVRFVAADFEVDALEPLLVAVGFDQRRPSLFLMEGIAVYLERPVLEAVLSRFHSVADGGSLLAISVSGTTNSVGAGRRRRAFRAGVSRMGEPVRSAIDVDQVVTLLSATGWRARGLSAGEDSARSRSVAAGFILADRA